MSHPAPWLIWNHDATYANSLPARGSGIDWSQKQLCRKLNTVDVFSSLQIANWYYFCSTKRSKGSSLLSRLLNMERTNDEWSKYTKPLSFLLFRFLRSYLIKKYNSSSSHLWFSNLCSFDDWSELNTTRSCTQRERFEDNPRHTAHRILYMIPLRSTFLRLSSSTTLIVRNRDDKTRRIKMNQTPVLSPSHSGAWKMLCSSAFRLFFVALTSRYAKLCDRMRFEVQRSIPFLWARDSLILHKSRISQTSVPCSYQLNEESLFWELQHACYLIAAIACLQTQRIFDEHSKAYLDVLSTLQFDSNHASLTYICHCRGNDECSSILQVAL